MLKLNGYTVIPTIFPDKTSQVWKLPEEVLDQETASIVWEFESEAEFMHLAQLRYLVGKYATYINLYLPYLPYARQDKEVANDATFALEPFVDMLYKLDFDEVAIFDAHNFNAVSYALPEAVNVEPEIAINAAMKATKATTILYPDKGAYDRYNELINFPGLCVVVAEKTRNQLTGEIVKTELTAPIYKTDRVLIVDDLCDGGATFIKLMPLIKQAEKVSLYVSHGIFSKGTQVLKDAGISRIFTKDGEVL
jgi:ribose-phosphate pyrophosphokinase